MNKTPVWFRPLNKRELERMAKQLKDMQRAESIAIAAGLEVRPKQTRGNDEKVRR